jgi:hypothetical protein
MRTEETFPSGKPLNVCDSILLTEDPLTEDDLASMLLAEGLPTEALSLLVEPVSFISRSQIDYYNHPAGYTLPRRQTA